MIRLVIVEDHPAIAEGLGALLRGEPDVELIGTAGDVEAASALIDRTIPDIVLCDVVLAGERYGLQLLSDFGGRRKPAFIMFSAYGYPDYYLTALEHGAAGYLLKMATIGEVMSAVRTVAGGGKAFPTEIAQQLAIHVKTVEGQLRRLFDRYDVANRTELVRVAEHEGWITAP